MQYFPHLKAKIRSPQKVFLFSIFECKHLCILHAHDKLTSMNLTGLLMPSFDQVVWAVGQAISCGIYLPVENDIGFRMDQDLL